MMRLVWTMGAIRSRDAIYDHIEADNPAAALRMDETFLESATHLLDNPRMGRSGRVPGTHELVVHPHYVLVYDIQGDALRILRVLHTARQWPPGR